MMKVRVVYKDDGNVAVIHPAPKSRRPDESEEQWLARVFQKAMANAGLHECGYDDIDESALPPRQYRNAWEGKKGQGISINEEKVKQIAGEGRATVPTGAATSGEGKRVDECGPEVREYLKKTKRSPAKGLAAILLKKGLLSEEDVKELKSLASG